MASLRLLSLATRYALGLVVLGAAACFVLWRAGAPGVLAVGGFATSNLWAWQALVRRAFVQGRPRPIYLAVLASKLVLTLGILTLIVLVLRPPALAIVLGFSSLFGGLALAMLHVSLAPPLAERT